MTDEQAVREAAERRAQEGDSFGSDVIRSLDAKDAEIDNRDSLILTALSRAEQAEAALAEAQLKLIAVGELECGSCEAIGADCGEHMPSWSKIADMKAGECAALEAALAEERKAHQAFREEVSEAINSAEAAALDQGPSATAIVRHYFDPLRTKLLPAKPAVDPLVAVLNESLDRLGPFDAEEAANLRAAIERAGGTIEFPDALLAQRSKP